METRLSRSFFVRQEVVQISRELLGKFMLSRIEGQVTGGMIVETEAYRAPDDRACHAYLNRCTPRTEIMFREGGAAYVYLCYGVHHLFNVVTGPQGSAQAVLIRALEPRINLEEMMRRRGHNDLRKQLTAGPGVLTRAMGITTQFTGQDLLAPNSRIWLEDRGVEVDDSQIIAGPRVGVDYAGECAARPWRFRLRDSEWTSRK